MRRPARYKPAMPCRSALFISTVCGLAPIAGAQELIRVNYSAIAVITGTMTPTGSLIGDLPPGQSVRFQVSLQALVNGTSAIGQTTTYTPPPPPGVGTIRGLGSFLYDFVTSGGSAAGNWYGRSISVPFTTAASTGTIANAGASLLNLGGTQFPAPGGTANGVNPVSAAFVGCWTPNDYNTPRFLNFRMQPGGGAPAGQANSLLVQYGNEPESNDPLYINKYVTTDFGQGVIVGLDVPAPAGTPMFALGALWLTRRKRQAVP
jgi:hypothetical protein